MGNVPVFLSLLKNVESKRRSWILFRESLIAYVVLVLFVFSGKHILSGLGLSEQSLRIAGGIILFLIAIRMIFPRPASETSKVIEDEPFIVPMAVPLIAGPSAMATVVLFATQQGSNLLTVFSAVTLASVVGTIILLLSEPLRRILRDRGLIAVERLMGMILTTLAVQMFLTGLSAFLKG